MIYIGYGLFSISIGFFIGSSNSPVVVAFFAILVGLVGAFFGALKLLDDSKSRIIHANYVGKLLSVFALGLIGGELIGESYRNNLLFAEYATLPWKGLDEPKTTYEALDWLMVKAKMKSLGYQDSDISAIYLIRLNEIKSIKIERKSEVEEGISKYEMTKLYDKESPFNEVLEVSKLNAQIKGFRGPSSVDN